MASSGQTKTQAQHSVQSSMRTGTAFSFSISKTFVGQFSTHGRQA